MSEEKTTSPSAGPGTITAFALLTLSGLAVFLPAITFSAMIPDGPETILRIALIAAIVSLWFVLKDRSGWHDQAILFLALGLAALAHLVGWRYGGILLDAFEGDLETMRGIGLAKAGSAGMTLVPIVLVFLFGQKAGPDFYLRMGRRGLIGLVIGVVAFFGFGYATFGSSLADDTALRIFLESLPWILLFVFSNALMEEIVFRGLFLSTAVKLMGKHLAALATALVFAAAHMTVTYTPDVPVFLAIVLGLSLIWAYLMTWSRSIWGSVVFHAGGDLIIMGGILQTMQ